MTLELHDLLDAFPAGTIKVNGGEHNAPCPYCPPEADSTLEKNGVKFVGNDRLIIWPDGKGVYCRICAAAGRGKDGKGYYSSHQLAQRLGLDVEGGFDFAAKDGFERKPLRNLWTAGQVVAAHKRLLSRPEHMALPAKRGLNEATVRRFSLGYGRIYDWQLDSQLLIPMRIQNVDEDAPTEHFYMAARGMTVWGEYKKVRSPGSTSRYLWHIQDAPQSAFVVITEGETDALAAYEIGFRNIICTFGASTWDIDKTRWVLNQGYREIYCLYDAGEAGQTQARLMGDMFTIFRCEYSHINWPHSANNNQDITDVLVELGAEKTNDWLAERRLRLITKKSKQQNISILGEKVELIMAVDALRQKQRRVVRAFLNTYDEKNVASGQTLLVGTPPGTGKTTLLVSEAEEIGRARKAEYLRRRAEISEQIAVMEIELNAESDPDRRETMKKIVDTAHTTLSRLSANAVAWFAPYTTSYSELIAGGADPELWFEYHSRNADNCEEFSTVAAMGQQAHNIGEYCRTACPLHIRNRCLEEGYLSQDKKAQAFPNVVFRHQHLWVDFTDKFRDLYVLDEFPGVLLEEPMVFGIEDIRPVHNGWADTIEDREAVQMIELFAEGVRETVGRIGYAASGKEVVEGLTETFRNKFAGVSPFALGDVTNQLDLNIISDFYQPNYRGGGENLIVKRCLLPFINVLLREMALYAMYPNHDYPSCLHFTGFKVHVYAHRQPKLRHRTPIVALDATGMPETYQALTRREVLYFGPSIDNPNMRTTVIRGSDYTNTAMRKQLDPSLRNKALLRDTLVEDMFGTVYDLSDAIFNEDVYDSRMVKHSHEVINEVLFRHNKTLVITHKKLRYLFEEMAVRSKGSDLAEAYEEGRLAFTHYGGRIRGSNQYQHFPSVLLIGAWRIPYDVLWERASMWAWMLGLNKPIPKQTIRKPMLYDTRGEVIEVAEYRTFDHEFADSYVQSVEQGELIQSAQRIRAFTTEVPKHIYMLMDRPAAQFIDKITQRKEFLTSKSERQLNEALTYLRRFYSEYGKLPSYSVAQQDTGLSRHRVKQAREILAPELQLT